MEGCNCHDDDEVFAHQDGFILHPEQPLPLFQWCSTVLKIVAIVPPTHLYALFTLYSSIRLLRAGGDERRLMNAGPIAVCPPINKINHVPPIRGRVPLSWRRRCPSPMGQWIWQSFTECVGLQIQQWLHPPPPATDSHLSHIFPYREGPMHRDAVTSDAWQLLTGLLWVFQIQRELG